MFGNDKDKGQVMAAADRKRYALIDPTGVAVYQVTGDYIETVDGSHVVAVYDGDSGLKIAIHLLPGQSLMEVVERDT